MVLFDIDFEPESFATVELIYNKNDPDEYTNMFFDFQVVYTRAQEEEEEDNLETRTVHKTHEFVREWLFRGGDKEEIEETVFSILKIIKVPHYGGIVKKLTNTMIDLKNRETLCLSPMVERVKVVINVMVSMFPGEEEDNVDVVEEEEDEWGFDVDVLEDEWGFNVDVKLAVAPASDEAVKAHLETVVVQNDEGYCVICMDEIGVESDVAAVRMPCLHVFHRVCGEEWLRNSGICPVCRVVFPS